ncbi:hypothetical protein H0266_17825 [Halobacillus locisalis]|uniref:Uncharacterized protein n=1 Tax=Halobacillus locisalis TaxID=220753 RepID=A0A838CX82_9BACI|nr:AimR family lysis-lysogeny pheromone receptor [Halobacillus locisalis]MBA2176752.1 hypothetical protein [Halobacillus locisalis]
MVDYHALEPKPIQTLQVNHTSFVYQYYLEQLKSYDRKMAIMRTKDFCMDQQSMDKEEQIATLEFLYMNDYMDELSHLIGHHSLDHEVHLIYGILLNRFGDGQFNPPLMWLKSLQFSHPSLHCLHQLIIVYRYFDLKKYSGLDAYLEKCDEALQKVNEPLALYYFELRYHELLFNHYWKTNNSLLARRYAYKIINKELSPRKTTMVQHHLALTYVFESYETSMDHAVKALHIAEEYNLTKHIISIKDRTIPFISAFHRVTDDVTTPDFVETAHLEIAREQYVPAIRMLKSLDTLTPFQESYLGFALKDKGMLKNAHQRFLKESGDLFFAQLPELYLER